MIARHEYRIDLSTWTMTSARGVRRLTVDDVAELPGLMLAAYAGTTDDEGETLTEAVEEIEGWLRNGGDLGASFGAEIDGRLCAAALVAATPVEVVLAYVITHPDHKRQGLGRRVVSGVLDGLQAGDTRAVHLWITEGNEPSERLFAGLGAKRVRALN
ncbi:MAG: GNAT family N-acetyltransferase [Actinomycetota bacterium]